MEEGNEEGDDHAISLERFTRVVQETFLLSTTSKDDDEKETLLSFQYRDSTGDMVALSSSAHLQEILEELGSVLKIFVVGCSEKSQTKSPTQLETTTTFSTTQLERLMFVKIQLLSAWEGMETVVCTIASFFFNTHSLVLFSVSFFVHRGS